MGIFDSYSRVCDSRRCASTLSGFVELIIEHDETFAFHGTMFVLSVPSLLDSSFSQESSDNTLVDIGKMQVSYTILVGG